VTFAHGSSTFRGAGFQPARGEHHSRYKSTNDPRALRRPSHPDFGSTAYFITTRTRDSEFIFGAEAAAAAVSELLSLRKRYGFLLLSYVFMSNHAHFVVVPAEGFTISQTMRVIKGAIARRVNAVLDREGPLWQDGFRDNAPQTIEELNNYIRYTENNPVKAGLCKRPGDFLYSSGDGRCIADYERFLGVGDHADVVGPEADVRTTSVPRAESPLHDWESESPLRLGSGAPSTSVPRAESPLHGLVSVPVFDGGGL
jgi:REP element-mobilizing transposase RayT